MFLRVIGVCFSARFLLHEGNRLPTREPVVYAIVKILLSLSQSLHMGSRLSWFFHRFSELSSTLVQNTLFFGLGSKTRPNVLVVSSHIFNCVILNPKICNNLLAWPIYRLTVFRNTFLLDIHIIKYSQSVSLNFPTSPSWYCWSQHFKSLAPVLQNNSRFGRCFC